MLEYPTGQLHHRGVTSSTREQKTGARKSRRHNNNRTQIQTKPNPSLSSLHLTSKSPAFSLMGDYYYDRGGGGYRSTTTDFRPYAVEREAGGVTGGGGTEIVSYNPSYRHRSPDGPPVPPRRSTSSQGSSWGFTDPEMKRRRRVASYKAYSVEGRMKASIRSGFRWFKAKCSELVHGW